MRLWLIISVLLPCLLVAQTPLEKAIIMPLKDVRPGMRGKIYTVFKGSEIEPFNAEVVGVLENFIGPGIDLILCKLPDAKTWNSGAVAGMSGSPLYIDGKLVGALGYGLQIFETERYCGVTPIEAMLSVEKFDGSTKSADPSARRNTQLNLASGKTADFSGLQRLSIPLSTSGILRKVLDLYSPALQKYGLTPTQASGGGASEKRIDAPFIPGAAISGVLVRGDMNMAGTGTLTYRDGNRVLAFGHPFFDMGKTEMPMAQAEIVTILPSLLLSFKVANIRQNIGTITQDRLTAIAGVIGPSPQTIPVSIVTTDPQSGTQTYSYEVSRIEQVTPMLLSMILASNAMRTMDYSDEFTLQVKGKATFQGRPEMIFDDLYSGDGLNRLLMIFDMTFKLSSILTNPYEPTTMTGLTLHWDHTPVRKSVTLESLTVDKQIVKPGDTVEITYSVRPWRQKLLTRKLTVKIPEEIKVGELELELADATRINKSFFFSSFFFMFMDDRKTTDADKLLRCLNVSELFAQGERPVTTGQLIDVFNRQVPQNAYYLRLMQNAPGIVVEDKVSENLPLSIVSVYQDSKVDESVTTINRVELLRTPVPQDGVALGSKSIRLQVINRP